MGFNSFCFSFYEGIPRGIILTRNWAQVWESDSFDIVISESFQGSTFKSQLTGEDPYSISVNGHTTRTSHPCERSFLANLWPSDLTAQLKEVCWAAKQCCPTPCCGLCQSARRRARLQYHWPPLRLASPNPDQRQSSWGALSLYSWRPQAVFGRQAGAVWGGAWTHCDRAVRLLATESQSVGRLRRCGPDMFLLL